MPYTPTPRPATHEYSKEDLRELVEAISQISDANVELVAAIREMQEYISALATLEDLQERNNNDSIT